MASETWGPCATSTTPPDDAEPGEFDEVGRGYYRCPGMDEQTAGGSATADKHPHLFRFPTTKDDANLISSECKDGFHRPVIDFDHPIEMVPALDFPVQYVASTTPGHGHLYIDTPMTWESYEKLLKDLEYRGLLEPGYVSASIDRGATFVRPAWVKKPEAAPPCPLETLPQSPPSPDFDIVKMATRSSEVIPLLRPMKHSTTV